MSKKLREEQLDFLSKIQKSKYSDIGDPEILQELVNMRWHLECKPLFQIMDISKEPESIFKLYGKMQKTWDLCC